MSNNALVPRGGDLPSIEIIAERGQQLRAASKALNTLISYKHDWNSFERWCSHYGFRPLPAAPETVAAYLIDRSRILKVSTLRRHRVTIHQAHVLSGYKLDMHDPSIDEAWKGICRTYGTAQHGKDPATIEWLRAMVATLDTDTHAGCRNRALLLVGFAGAFRRSELAALRYEDIAFDENGVKVTIRRSKTDQEGQGREIGIPYGSNLATCPVRALKEWIEAAGITEGFLWRRIDKGGLIRDEGISGDFVAEIVKRVVTDKALAEGKTREQARAEAARFAGHSLRSGFVTTAAAAQVPEHTIMRQTGHKDANTLRKYIRGGTIWTDNAATKVGL